MVEFHIVEQVAPPRVPGFSNEEERAMQRAVIALFERWGLTDAEASILLGDISARTF